MKMTILMMIGAAILLATYQSAGADSLRGFVHNEKNLGIPGLTVSVVRPSFRSSPSITDSSGYYFFTNLPPGGDYYLEIYWGRDLLYRKGVTVSGDSEAPAITLAH